LLYRVVKNPDTYEAFTYWGQLFKVHKEYINEVITEGEFGINAIPTGYVIIGSLKTAKYASTT
jgi:hypothetical protein